MQPLAYGFLSGKYSQTHCFAEQDWRTQLSPLYRRCLEMASQQFLKRFAAYTTEYTPAEIAIAFCMANPALDKVVIGPKTRSQLLAVFKAHALAQNKIFRTDCANCTSL